MSCPLASVLRRGRPSAASTAPAAGKEVDHGSACCPDRKPLHHAILLRREPTRSLSLSGASSKPTVSWAKIAVPNVLISGPAGHPFRVDLTGSLTPRQTSAMYANRPVSTDIVLQWGMWSAVNQSMISKSNIRQCPPSVRNSGKPCVFGIGLSANFANWCEFATLWRAETGETALLFSA